MNTFRYYAPSAMIISSLLNVVSAPCAAHEGAAIVEYFGYQAAVELKNEDFRVILCPEVGGRILEYSCDGKNVLFLSEEDRQWLPGHRPAASAGRFDIGPELVIPERKVLWSGKWTGEITGPRKARLSSQTDPATGVRLLRDFELDRSSSRLLCTQTIINESTEVKEWCHWSRTFAVGKGICVIPLTDPSRFPNDYVMYEEGSLINMRPQDPAIRRRGQYLEIFGTPRKPKLGFDSYAGELAYVAPNGLLFLKRFATFPDRVYNEAAGLTLSVWYPNGDMVELEPIGPRERLAPNERASFTEEWWLAPMTFPAASDQLDLETLQQLMDTLKSSP